MDFEEILTNNGYTITKARKEVFNLLKAADRPVGIGEIINQLPTIDRATIYRSIELFENLHIVGKLWFGGEFKYELSELFDMHHHHLVCENCGRVEKVDNSALEIMLKRITKKFDYSPTKHNIELFGLCQDCSPAQIDETEDEI